MFCEHCGKQMEDTDVFCPHCGIASSAAASAAPQPEKKGRSKTGLVIALVCLILFLLIGGGIFIFLFVAKEPSETTNTAVEEIETEDREIQDSVNEDREEKTPDTSAEESSADNKPSENEPSENEPSKEKNEETISRAAPVTMSAVKTVTASSALSEYNMTHSPDRVIDGDRSTAWVEGAAGQGIDESIILHFDTDYTVSGINICAGYQISEDLYYKNSRPKEILVEFSGGKSQTYQLEDKLEEQKISFAEPAETDYVSISIVSVYPGNKYEDTVISEISLY